MVIWFEHTSKYWSGWMKIYIPFVYMIMIVPFKKTTKTKRLKTGWWGAVGLSYLPGAQFRIRVFELVPDGLEDGGKWSDADTGTDQHADLIVEHILTGCAKRSIYAQPDGKKNFFLTRKINYRFWDVFKELVVGCQEMSCWMWLWTSVSVCKGFDFLQFPVAYSKAPT